MPIPLEASIKPTVAVPITATAKATPLTLVTISSGRRAALVKVTAANIMASGTAVREQVWIGVRKYGDTGATWEPFMAPILHDGEIIQESFDIRLSEVDEVVCYASAANKINVLLEYGEIPR